ncbi:MAG TPA: hypothetical protein VJN02_09380 [Gammaproteobacteria bacterium]|nr:hypothetical protein [Gammaproteobacteria bacterium]
MLNQIDHPRGMKPRGRPKGESCATPPWVSPIALSRGKPRGINFKFGDPYDDRHPIPTARASQ